VIEFDCETTSLATHGSNPCRVFLAQFGSPRKDGVSLLYRDDAQPYIDDCIQDWLDMGDEFRAWNTKFDLRALKQNGFKLPSDAGWHDGMVAAHIIDERRSVALQARADALLGPEAGAELEQGVRTYLNEERKRRRKASKDTGEEFVEPNYSDVPREIMDEYAAHDIINTKKVSDVYYPQIAANPAFQRLYDMEMDVMRALFWAEDRGIPVDREAMVNCEAAVLPEIERLEDEAVRIADFKGFNPRSPKQISEALERLGADTSKMTKSGASKQFKTDEENLGACDHPLADAILAYRGEEGVYKWLSGALHGPSSEDEKRKFPGAYLTSEDRLHPNFRQLGARTGRMSCSNPNFQNIPRDDLRIRYAIRAEEGHKLVTCDLDSIEMMLLAMFAGSGVIHETVWQGKDLHALTAARVGLTGRRRASGATESPRDQGKRLNYLIVYGGGVNAIQKWFGVPRDRAKQIMNNMHRAYPEVGALQGRIDYKLEEEGYLESPLTMRRWRMYGSGHVAMQKESYRFINYLIQGTAADVLKLGLVAADKAGLPVIGAVHDELLLHVPTPLAEEAARELERCMTTGFELVKDGRMLEDVIPLSAEAKIVDRWSQAKDPDYVPDYAN
jgi:DNA polymerase I